MISLGSCLVCEAPCKLSELLCLKCTMDSYKKIKTRTESPNYLTDNIAVYAACEYSEPWAKLIRLCKNQNSFIPPQLLIDLFDKIIEHWIPEIRNYNIDAIMAVPSNLSRECFSFAFSKWIAEKIAHHTQLPNLSNDVRKKFQWFENSQKSLPAERRIRQSQHSFVYRSKQKKPKARSVLIVDDVCTTGSSILALHKLLQEQNISSNTAWVLAQTPLNIQGKLVRARPLVETEKLQWELLYR
jgi:predicted amidophosphoribosyltransferase